VDLTLQVDGAEHDSRDLSADRGIVPSVHWLPGLLDLTWPKSGTGLLACADGDPAAVDALVGQDAEESPTATAPVNHSARSYRFRAHERLCRVPAVRRAQQLRGGG
jgi:hypothetical protein